MSIIAANNLDPSTIKDDASLREFCGSLVAEIRKVKDDATAASRAAEDAVAKWRAAEEQLDASKRAAVANRQAVGTEKDILGRYMDGASLRLRASTRSVEFGGQRFDIEEPGLLDDREAMTPEHLAFQRAVGHRTLVRLAMGPSARTPQADADVIRAARRLPGPVRDAVSRAFADSAGAGGEFIPDVFSPDLWMAFEIPSALAAAFRTETLSGPTIKPKMTGQPRPFKMGADSTSDQPAVLPATSITTSSQTLEPPMFGMRTLIGIASAEDAAMPIVSILQQMLPKALADGYEDCMVNGDTTATHEDAIATWNIRSRWGTSGLGGSNDHRRAFKGFRRIAVDRTATTDQSGGQTVAKILEELVGGHGEYAADDVVIVTSPEVYFKKIATDSNVLTVDKFGPSASILRGAPASIGGKPILLSRFVSSDLATTGLYTGTGAYSGVLSVARSAFAHYQRRGPTVELTRTANTQTIELVATLRRGMDTLSASTEKVVTYGYKWL
jgi:hypothetical protein